MCACVRVNVVILNFFFLMFHNNYFVYCFTRICLMLVQFIKYVICIM